MQVPQPHEREALRVEMLRACDVLDTAPELAFDDIVHIAAHVTGCPIALVSLVDEARQWFKSRVGLGATQTPRDVSFCGHAINTTGADFVVDDAREDPRFADNPLVTGDPHVTFYAGVPLKVGPGRLPVGTLCVIDTTPRQLDDGARHVLHALARQVEGLLELRLRNAQLADVLARLRAADDQLNAIVRAMHDGVVVQQESGAITWCNEAAERILGLSLSQMMGLTSVDPAWHSVRADGTPFPGDEHPAMVCLRTGEPIDDVIMGVGLGAKLRWINISARPMRREGQTQPYAVVASFADVTELRVRQVELERARDIAESATRAKAEFLATMSHELRTPMNGVIGMTELLLADGPTAAQAEMLHAVKDSGAALLRIINDILDYSKIEAGGRALMPVPVQPSSVARDVLHVLAHEVRRKGLSVDLADTPVIAFADAAALRQVLFNLVGNAVKFTQHGRVGVHVRVIGPRCRIEVKDSGIGLAPDEVSRLFRRFSQAASSTANRFGGTGLGLAISKKLVEGMGGDIGVDSVPGEGSTFWFTLPLAPDGLQPQPLDAPNANVCASSALRVLLAEDNLINQRVSAGMLTRLGHDVVVVGDGEAAVAAVRKTHFDLVLMDLQMPRLNGLDATRLIRAWELERSHRPTPIFALTASVMREDQEACLAAGMNEVLAKPLTMRALEERLATLREPR